MGQHGSCAPLPEPDAPPAAEEIYACRSQAGVPVTLHIYDVFRDAAVRLVNEVFRPAGTGLFHAGVEVYGKEWSYGYRDEEGTGIFSVDPRGNPAHTYRESVSLGRTLLLWDEVNELTNEIAPDWPGKDYDLASYNCLDFCIALSDALGTGRVPAWATSFRNRSAPLLRGVQAVQTASYKARDWWYSTHVVLECVYASTVDVSSVRRRDRCIAVTIPTDARQPIGPRQQPTTFDRLVPDVADFPEAHLAHDHAFELAWEPPCLYLRKPRKNTPLLVNGAPVQKLTYVLLHNSEISLCDEEEEGPEGSGQGPAPRLTFRVLRGGRAFECCEV